VYVFSPSFLMNFRYGLTQQEFPERRVTQGYDLASLGFAPSVVNAVDPSLATFPRVQADGLTTLSAWESGDGSTASLTHSFTANFTRLAGSHNIRFGPEFRVYREFRNRFQTDVSPDLNFDATYTRGPLDTNANPTRGGAIASLLLGIPAGNMTRTASYAEQDKYFSLYIHDDWKITQKLTLNLGLRSSSKHRSRSDLTVRFRALPSIRRILSMQPLVRITHAIRFPNSPLVSSVRWAA
jgi:hypothetical protein